MLPSTRAAAAGVSSLALLPLLAACGSLGSLGQLGAPPHNKPATSFTVPGPVSAVVIRGG